jgi:two-component system chemotaxis sensor kinase CheA
VKIPAEKRDRQEEEFAQRLRAMFRIEAVEHIAVLSSGLIELEKTPEEKNALALIETIFREAHSLKGAARSVNRSDIESVCQELESIFAVVKNKTIVLTAEQYDCIHKAVDIIAAMVKGTNGKVSHENKAIIVQLRTITEEGRTGKISEGTAGDEHKPPGGILHQSMKLPENSSSAPEDRSDVNTREEISAADPAGEKYPPSQTIRIQTAKLDQLFLQAEQMIQSKLASVQRAAELKGIASFVGSWKTELRKVETRRTADSKTQLKELLGWTHEMLEETERNIGLVIHANENDQRSLGRMIDEHVDAMKKVLMLPLATMIEVFPKLVRDLARRQGKEVELLIQGKDIEVDKRILEELKDPLIHLLRNCIDHGIHDARKREKARKPAQGTITLNFAVLDGRSLEVTLSDDGGGIDITKVQSAAVTAGILSFAAVDKLTPQESFNLIFHSGLSTSPIITDISGRGLGLAIVREKVEKLGGKVFVESRHEMGTTFRLIVPLTLSTVRGVLVRTGDQLFFIPLDSVERVLRVRMDMIKTVENRESMIIDNELVPVFNLSDILSIPKRVTAATVYSNTATPMPQFIQLVVLTHGAGKIGVSVDEIFDEQQILVKDLGHQLQRVRNFSGAAVLGSGAVVPVFNVPDLIKSAIQSTATAIPGNGVPPETKVYKILAADDSITSRTLIKNILESAKYEVVTAVDGADAFMKVLIGDFDLVVSDVDMPRLNGFELTAKIRKDKKIFGTPVVLVTALDSREDREHGIDVGANAYIIKSSFDQSNLLDVIKKLL